MSSRRVKIGSLFAGIGGLDKGIEDALRAAGIHVKLAWQVEKNDFARAVLAKHWPGVNRSVTDVRAASPLVLSRVDWIVGGFPCQDVSGAGKGAGLDGERSGLWWEYRRIVAAFRPAIVIVENVASGKSRWLCPVRRSLHELGYHTAALGISAQDVGAPHIRERIFVVAYRPGSGPQGDGVRRRSAGRGARPLAEPVGAGRDSGGGARGEDAGGAEPSDGRALGGGSAIRRRTRGDRARAAESGVGGDAARLPAGLDRNPGRAIRWPASPGEQQHGWEPPRAASGVPQQSERLIALGNAVVPACAEEVGRWIVQNLL